MTLVQQLQDDHDVFKHLLYLFCRFSSTGTDVTIPKPINGLLQLFDPFLCLLFSFLGIHYTGAYVPSG